MPLEQPRKHISGITDSRHAKTLQSCRDFECDEGIGETPRESPLTCEWTDKMLVSSFRHYMYDQNRRSPPSTPEEYLS